ncbi:MAG: dihydroorotate dehydrogenase (quinone) [Verrucomicrobia bacterium]|nr:MAG: dihydroorotate dehydrogenase (quinone) [Verrucomicrobiota bacterium]
MGMYHKIIRPLLFKQDPERAHSIAVFTMRMIGEVSPLAALMRHWNKTEMRPIKLFGLTFPNHVGIAAGFDKNAECFKAAGAFGFGHVEIGTVTYHRQSGQAKPRLFRYPDQEAIINRMGFNNDGAHLVADRLKKCCPKSKAHIIPLGINIGKSQITPIEEAHEDYVNSFKLLADYADYFAVNVSSPNTAGLRELQGKEHLLNLLGSLKRANAERARKLGVREIPMLLKIAPDLTFPQIDSILTIIQDLNFAGIIATNTTLKRPGFFENVDCAGGLSGRPLLPFSTNVIKYIALQTRGKIPIVGVGGIMDPVSAEKIMDAGASLVQVYTGLIYNGPFMGREIANALAWRQRNWV